MIFEITSIVLWVSAGVKGVQGIRAATATAALGSRVIKKRYPRGGFLDVTESKVTVHKHSSRPTGREIAKLAEKHWCLKPFVGKTFSLTQDDRERLAEVLIPAHEEPDDPRWAKVLARWLYDHPRVS